MSASLAAHNVSDWPDADYYTVSLSFFFFCFCIAVWRWSIARIRFEDKEKEGTAESIISITHWDYAWKQKCIMCDRVGVVHTSGTDTIRNFCGV